MQQPSNVPWTLRKHLVQFICLVNELQPMYDILERNNLSTGILDRLVHRCSSVDPAEVPRLSDDGRFISRFLVRNCGNYLEQTNLGQSRSTAEEPEIAVPALEAISAALVREPSHLKLNRTQLGGRAPRWVWDPHIYSTGRWQYANIVQDIVGREKELGKFPMFTQGQPIVSMEPAPWRRQDLHEWQHTPRDVLRYRPGTVWINAEVWAAPKGKDTGFHYDYDSHVHLFQVVGSRRFNVLPPQSGALDWTPLKHPPDNPIDYGTRWGDPSPSEHERIYDTSPGSVLRIPNGWPHKVVYKERSIGFRVASWTQCQALSMYLGQRLCLLSTALGTQRLCFDDEGYREHGKYLDLERSKAVV